MRFAYMDEAGTSPKEPVSVVVAVIVEADQQRQAMERALADIYETLVPDPFRQGFQFHATDLFSGGRISGRRLSRDEWPLQERLDLLKAVESLSYAFDAPLAVSSWRRWDRAEYPQDVRQMAHDVDHYCAFQGCAEKVDHYLRSRTGGREGAILVAEEAPRMRRFLPLAVEQYRKSPMHVPADGVVPGKMDRFLKREPVADTRRIEHVLYDPIFLKKGRAPLLDVADACAFIVRRWLSGLPHVDALLNAMLGGFHADLRRDDEVWMESGCTTCLINHVDWDAMQRDQEDRRLWRAIVEATGPDLEGVPYPGPPIRAG